MYEDKTFPFLRYFCPNLKGEFVIIKKLDDSEFLQINHVTVYTTETPKGLNYFNERFNRNL